MDGDGNTVLNNANDEKLLLIKVINTLVLLLLMDILKEWDKDWVEGEAEIL